MWEDLLGWAGRTVGLLLVCGSELVGPWLPLCSSTEVELETGCLPHAILEMLMETYFRQGLSMLRPHAGEVVWNVDDRPFPPANRVFLDSKGSTAGGHHH